MGRFTNRSHTITDDPHPVAQRQWLRMRVPSDGADGYVHIGRPGTDSRGYRGITLSTAANFMVNAVSGSLFQSGGPSQFQSVGDWTQLSNGHMNSYAHGNMNIGAKGGVVIASIGTSTADITAVADHSGDASGDLPGLTTHPHFAIDRNKIYDDFQNTKNWANLVAGLISGVKTLLGSSFDGSALAKFTTVMNDVTQLINVATNSVSVGRGAGTLDHAASDEEKQGTGSAGGTSTAGTSSGLAAADPLDTSGQANLAATDIGYGAGYAGWAGATGVSGSQSLEQAMRQAQRRPGEDEVTYQARITALQDDAKAARNTATADLTRLTGERDALQHDVSDLQAQRDATPRVSPVWTDLDNEMKAKQALLDAKQTEVDTAQTKANETQARVQVVDSQERTDAATRMQTAQTEHATAQTELTTAQTEHATAQTEFDAAKAHREALDNDPRSAPGHADHAAWETEHNAAVADEGTKQGVVDARAQTVSDKEAIVEQKQAVVDRETDVQTRTSTVAPRVTEAQTDLTSKQQAQVTAQSEYDAAKLANDPDLADKERALNAANSDVENAEKTLQREQSLADSLEQEKGEAWKGRLNTAGEALGALAAVAGAAAATAGLASAITATKKSAPPGVATISTDDIFVGTATAYTAMANGGFSFIAPNISGFNVLTGGGIDMKSGLQASMFALQGVAVEGGMSAEVVAGGGVSLHSRMKDISVVGKEVKIGAALTDVPNLVKGKMNPFAQMPTQEVTIKTIETGKIEISVGPLCKVVMTPARIKLSFGAADSIEMAATGITMKSATKIALEAPQVAIKGTAAVNIEGAAVSAKGTASVTLESTPAKLEVTPASINGTAAPNSLKVGSGMHSLE